MPCFPTVTHLPSPRFLRGFAAALVMLAACGDDDTPDVELGALPSECENLSPDHCMMPWPSSRYLTEDPDTATGLRVELPPAALPQNQSGDSFDVAFYERFDGFSPMTSLVAFFPGEIDDADLPDETDIAGSLSADSPTVVIDAETGERVAHFAELDEVDLPAFPNDPARRVLYIRPARRLAEGRRYVAAIRGLRYVDGTDVPPSDYFRALRDGLSTDSAELEARRAGFEDVFATLEGAGVERSSLLVAWDFHTASGPSLWSDALAMRDAALEAVGPSGTTCTVTSVRETTPEEDPNVWRRIEGTFTVPLFMDGPDPGARLVRDADGAPMQSGTAEAPFLAIVPHSAREAVLAGEDGARLLHYNHGQFGSRGEAGSSFPRAFAQRFGFVNVATDMWGMSSDDQLGTALPALLNWSEAFRLGERLMQGLVNNVVLTRSFLGGCRALEELEVDGRSVIGDEAYYLGISQGANFGPSVAALSPDIDRFVFNVGAISYPMMIRRSANFADLEAFFGAELTAYPDKVDRDFLLVFGQSVFDVAEGATFAPHLLRDPLPGVGTKRVLSTIARWDPQVSNTISHVAARTMGLPLVEPSVVTPWGLEGEDGPLESGYQIYDTGGPEIPPGTLLPMGAPDRDSDPHEQLRRLDASQLQWDAFLRPDGLVQSFCDGPCDPE